MASAGERVFALPELLESILLNLTWRDLFGLLRTNATFRDTIMRSTELRRCMHLEYKSPDDEAHLRSTTSHSDNFIVKDLKDKEDLDFGPFGTSGWAGFSDEWGTFDATVYLYIPGRYSLSWSKTAALILRLNTDMETGSWRMMKLTHLQAPLHVEVEVYPFSSTQREMLEFAAGEGTFGQLVDAIHRIQKHAAQCCENEVCMRLSASTFEHRNDWM